MGKAKSDSVFRKIFVGVAVTVISTMMITHLGLEEDSSSPVPAYSTPSPSPSHTQTTAQTGNWCCDAWGNSRCQMVTPLTVGSPCFCPGQGSGVVCR